MPGGHAFTKLAFGMWHTCGITASGAAYCWGWNYYGQLGNGIIADDSVSTPVPVTGGHTFVDIAASEHTTCGLTASGEIYCWGSNDNGALGNLWMEDSPYPVRVGGDHTYRAIGMGYGGTCAIREDGQIVGWAGQCGQPCSLVWSQTPHGAAASRWSASGRDGQAIPSGWRDEHWSPGLGSGARDGFHPNGVHGRSAGTAFRGLALPGAAPAVGMP